MASGSYHRRMYRYLAFLFFSIIISLAVAGQRQSPRLVIRHYTSDNGLPQNSVLDILFDKSGYCWIATEAGLVRFDNNGFRTYGTDNIPGLMDERIHELKTDTSGNVFAKNVHHQTISTIPFNDLFSPLPFVVKGEDPNYYPDAGYLSPNPLIGMLWDSIVKAASMPLIRSHYCLRNGDTYLSFAGCIYWLTNNGTRLLKKWPSAPATTAPVGNFLLQLWPGNNIALWQHDTLLPVTKLSGDVLSDPFLLRNPPKLLWCPAGTFMYSDGDLYSLSVAGHEVNTQKVLGGLSMEAPSCIYYMPGNNTYYIGTRTNGLFVVKPSGFYTPFIPKNFDARNLYAIGKTSKDVLIVRNTFIPKGRPAYYISLNNGAFFVYVDKADRMYYQSQFKLYRFDTRSKKDSFLFNLDERLIAVLPDTDANGLLVCTAKSLTCLSQKDKILWKKDLPIKYDAESATGLFPLEKNKYILLTSLGVKWYDIASDKIYKSILDSIRFRSFYKDRSGRLWFGSDGSGAFMYQNGRIYQLPLGDLKQLKTVHAFIDDGNGFFWLPTNNGLFKVNINSLVNYITHKTGDIYLYSLNSRDGLSANEFNGGCSPAFQWLSDSTLVLPSMGGLVEFQPSKLEINYPENKIFLDEFRIDTEKTEPSSLNKTIEIKPDFNLLTIKISCPYFGNPRNLQLEYAVHRSSADGYQWQSVPPTGQLSINTLSAGNYEIIIRKSGYRVDEKNAGLILKIKVLPYFYDTWWFYLLVAAFIILAGYLILRIRVAQLKKEKQKIEKIVSERTLELDNTAQQLRFSESALKQSNQVKEQVITMVLHDLRSPIRFLKNVTSGIMNSFKNEIPATLLDNLKKLNGSVVSLWEFTDRFFSWAVTQQDNFEVKKTSFPLQEVFDIVASFYSEIVLLNTNSLNIVNTNIFCFTDKDMLLLILRNLVDNANKNTFGGKIVLSAAGDTGHVYISVKDEGKGMEDHKMAMFENAEKSAGNGGVGSQVIVNMLKRIDGTLSINTSPAGSTFVVTVQADDANTPKQ